MSAEFAEMTENSDMSINEDGTVQDMKTDGTIAPEESIADMTSSQEADSSSAASASTSSGLEDLEGREDLAQQGEENLAATVAVGENPEEILAPEVTEAAPEAADGDVVAQLATQVESLRLQVEERTSQYMRIAADFDNFRKRNEREKSELELRVKRDAISELLPVIDSFERARTQIKPQTDQEVNIHKSYQGVYKQLVDCLKRVGVSPMRVEGQPFDPVYHDAIMREATNEHPEGTVIEDLRRGYLMGDLVLRHAMVKVAIAADPTAPSEAGEDDSGAE